LENVLAALAIVAAAWVAFLPAMRGDWLWDDNTEIVRNLDLRGPSALWTIWIAPSSPDYFPVKSTVQWLQWQFWHEQSTVGYHLSNLGLHVLGALLLWRVLRKLGVRYAWLGGLFFAVHPAVVESVVWIAELKNVLSLPALLLAFSAYLDYDERRRPLDYIVAVLWFVVAMLCKSSVVMFPCFLLLHAWWKRGYISLRDAKASSSFFAVSLILGLVTLWFQNHRAIDTWAIALGGPFDRMVSTGRALAFYSLKAVWPCGLMPVYPSWPAGNLAFWSVGTWCGLAGIFTWMWIRRATWGRHVLLPLGWFVSNLLPVLGFTGMSFLAIAPVADHFMYLSLVGFAGFVAVSVKFIERRLPIGWSRYPAVLVLLVCGVLVWQSRSYAAVFVNQETLWTYNLVGNPQSWLAHNNLGVFLQQQEKWQQSVTHFEAAVAIKPAYAPARVNLGNSYAHLGRGSDAVTQYQEAVRLDPDSFEAHFNFANTLVQMQGLLEAVRHFEVALKISPRAADAHYNLANALVELGRLSEAETQYADVLRYNPASFETHLNLGNLLAATGRLPEAMNHFEVAVRLTPQSGEAHFAYADALAQGGRFPEAVMHYTEALAWSPNAPGLHTNFAYALMRLGRTTEALNQYEEALRLDPNDQDASNGLRVAGQNR
jgi:tetratricopeptide (TPR) repeat protein